MTQTITAPQARPTDSAPAVRLSPTLTGFTVLLAILTLVTSLFGLLSEWPYAAETASWRLQGRAQDAGNLLAVLVLLGGFAGARRGSVRARQVWLGSLFYLAYAFMLYAMTVHFGPLFLPYVAVLGLSVYGVLFGVRSQASRVRVQPAAIRAGAFKQKTAYEIIAGDWSSDVCSSDLASRVRVQPAAIRIGAISLGVIGGLFALLWLVTITSALVSGQTPIELVETGLPSNPVHVLDLALVLPAMVLTAVRSRHDATARFLLAPWLVFSALMAASIAILMAASSAAGPGLAVVGTIAVASAAVAVHTLRHTTELPA